jgi:hypothetical protein
MAVKSRVKELMDSTIVVPFPLDAVVGLGALVVLGLLGAVVVEVEVLLLLELLHAAAARAVTNTRAEMALRLLTGRSSPYLRLPGSSVDEP